MVADQTPLPLTPTLTRQDSIAESVGMRVCAILDVSAGQSPSAPPYHRFKHSPPFPGVQNLLYCC